jgi:hypothetical protein
MCTKIWVFYVVRNGFSGNGSPAGNEMACGDTAQWCTCRGARAASACAPHRLSSTDVGFEVGADSAQHSTECEIYEVPHRSKQ